MRKANLLRHLWQEQRGVLFIEMAILLPVFLLLAFAVISFGYVFFIYEYEGLIVGSAASAIQNNPTNPATTRSLVASAGAPFISFTGANTICAQSFAQGATLPNPYCTGNTWVTTPPTGVTAGTPYQVAVVAVVTPQLPVPTPYTWLINKAITQKTIVTISGSPNFPVCPAGQYLTSTNGSSLTCATPTPPSGSFCGNAYQTNCAGRGAIFTPNVTNTACVVGGTSYNPLTSCPAGYSRYRYVDVGSLARSDTCFWTCLKN